MTTKLQKIQDHLKEMYSPTEYKSTIENIQARAGYDIEILAQISCDHSFEQEVRQFALAAMGDL